MTEVRRDNGNAEMPNTRHKVKMEYSLLDIVTEVEEYYGASYRPSVRGSMTTTRRTG